MKITILTDDEYRKVKYSREVDKLIAYDEILVEKLAEFRDVDVRSLSAGASHLKLDIARSSLKIRSVEDITYRNGVYDGITALLNLVADSKQKIDGKRSKSKMTTSPLTGELVDNKKK